MPTVTHIYPVFSVRDMREALNYYGEKLGFSVRWTWGDPISRAGVSIGQVEIQLDEPEAGVPLSISNAYCHMTDIDSYFADCRDRGAMITSELEARPWRMRDFRVVDPSGNVLGFGEQSRPTSDTAPADSAAVIR